MSPIIISIFFVIVFTIILTAYLWLSEYFELRRIMGYIPGPKTFPFVGLSWKLSRIPVEDRFRWLNDLCFTFERGIVVTWFGTKPVVNIRKPWFIQTILSSYSFMAKSEAHNMLTPWLSKGLLMSSGNAWLYCRHLISSAYGFDAIKCYFKVMKKNSITLDECLDKEVKFNPKAPVNILTLITKYSLDTIYEIAVGLIVNTQQTDGNLYTESLYNFYKICIERSNNVWSQWALYFYQTKTEKILMKDIRVMHDFMEQVIRNKMSTKDEKTSIKKDFENLDSFGEKMLRKFRFFQKKPTIGKLREKNSKIEDKRPIENEIINKENETSHTIIGLVVLVESCKEWEDYFLFKIHEQIQYGTFLDHLLEINQNSESQMTLEEMRQEIETLIFTGHLTISAAIIWTLFTLGNELNIQEQVHKELNKILDHTDNVIDIEQLEKIKYLDRVIQEVLRLYPSISSIVRCIENDAVIDNFFIPKGTTINIQIYQLHRDPEIWHNPEVFDPDRFLPENTDGRHSYAYIPFSAGPRNCIGQKLAFIEIKTVLVTILRKWRVLSLLKPYEVKFTSNFVLRPSNNKLELYFQPLLSV